MSETNWINYIPLAVMGFIFSVLIIGVTDIYWLTTPLNLSIIDNRLDLLFFSFFGGSCFFGMVQFGFFIWKGALFILDKLTVLYVHLTKHKEDNSQ